MSTMITANIVIMQWHLQMSTMKNITPTLKNDVYAIMIHVNYDNCKCQLQKILLQYRVYGTDIFHSK
jgi:hypothetical protein